MSMTMFGNDLEVLDGTQTQSPRESISYSIDTEPWGGSPSSPSCDIFDEVDFAQSVKGSKMTGSITVSGDLINLPHIHNLNSRSVYTVRVLFTIGGNTVEGFFRIECEG